MGRGGESNARAANGPLKRSSFIPVQIENCQSLSSSAWSACALLRMPPDLSRAGEDVIDVVNNLLSLLQLNTVDLLRDRDGQPR
jgi:hypothetical protein